MATAATAGFIESYMPGGATILEIGCGAGHVAAELASRGYEIIGIESDAETAVQARRRGVKVIEGSWPDVDAPAADAVVFTRSLHHISPLPAAVAGAASVLKPGGVLLIEDFAFEKTAPAAIDWLLVTIESGQGRALVAKDPGDFVTALLNADDPVDAWFREHDHDLHTSDQMLRAVEDALVVRATFRVPYLYRYLIDVLPQSREAAVFVEEACVEESDLGVSGVFPLIGLRIVAEAR